MFDVKVEEADLCDAMWGFPISQHGKLIQVYLRGSGFVYNQVRCTIGTLVSVGRGSMSPQQFKGVLDSCDRTKAGETAPPGGLYLVNVQYPDPFNGPVSERDSLNTIRMS
jgi:tRNA pseudouridine(38-40) synthase